MSGSDGWFSRLPVVAKLALVLLLSGGGLAAVAVIWLVVFGVTDGAAPIPTPPGAPPTPALVMLVISIVCVVLGVVIAAIYRRSHPR